MSRRVWVMVGCGLVQAGLALWWFGIEPIRQNRRGYDRVRADLVALAAKRPPEVSGGEWGHLVCRTLQMHGNCWWPPNVGRDWMGPFAAELERRLAGPVGVDTIDWIWDEYAGHTRNGRSYSDEFRPTHQPAGRGTWHPDAGSPCGIDVP